MKRLIALFALLVMAGGAAQAAIINVTGANYIVVKVYRSRESFGVDLIQNGAAKNRTEVHINKDAHCYRVHRGGGPDTPVSRDEFWRMLHKGTRVRVNGGRNWDGKINASDLWAQE